MVRLEMEKVAKITADEDLRSAPHLRHGRGGIECRLFESPKRALLYWLFLDHEWHEWTNDTNFPKIERKHS